MGDRPPPKEVWRPGFVRDRRRDSADPSDGAPEHENNSRGTAHKRTPSEESRNGRYQPNKRGSGRSNFDLRDKLQGARGRDSSRGRSGNLGMTPTVESDRQPANSTRDVLKRWVTSEKQNDGWTTASNKRGGKKGGTNRYTQGEQLPESGFPKTDFSGATSDMTQSYSRAAGSSNVGRTVRGGSGYSRGGRGRGCVRGSNVRSTIITQLSSLDDWTSLSTFDNPLRIMLKLQEFEKEWIPLFHSNASYEVIDIALDLFCRIDAKYKYGKLALMKSLFTATFFERLMQLLVKLKGSWFSSGKDKIVGFVEKIRHNIGFILSNDPAFHDNITSKNQLSSLVQECITLLTHINTKLLDLQGSSDETIEKEIQKIEELSNIKYIEMLVLEEPTHPEDFLSTFDVMPNIVHGAYESDDHYVQTHFGLLKEDFQSVLREGVEQYLVDPKQRNFKIWAYDNVVVNHHFSNRDSKKVLFRVTFPECKYFSKIQWKYVKRFMFGSLIVLTANKFDTYYLALIEDRNFEKPDSIYIVINFINPPPKALEQTKFLLVEPKAFYEPYLHSMRVLKLMAKIGLPLKKYIVNADTTPAVPAYVNNDTSYRIGTHDIKITNILSWPSAQELGLNRSQREAFMNALTSEMALIQGPPGTGKTFLAFKIIATLLVNKKNSYKDGPIMVVCYKNHSLDQILEGLLYKGKKIVRIGGMSKVKALKYDCNVRNLPAPPTISALEKEKHDLEDKSTKLLRGIQDIVEIINLVKSRIGIVNFELFKQCGVADSRLDVKLDQWLMELVRTAPQIPVEEIRNLRSSLRYNSLSLFRVFGSESLSSCFAVNLYDLGGNLFELEAFFKKNANHLTDDQYWQMNDAFWRDTSRYNYLAHGLKLAVDPSECPDPRSASFRGYHNLELEDRWALYNKWEQDFIAVLENKLIMFQNHVSEIEENLHEYNEMVMGQTLKYERPDVIGVTTSGASKHYSALADVGAKIVLVEEAAEVLEAHVIASLSTKCQHLILIGDHQQLKPTTASFKLGKQYRMEISLFERMINNEIKWSCLSTQHRMRPEIAALICPSIYRNLINSPSVSEYPNVVGTKKNVFFFNHSYPEQVGYDSESKFNPMEGEMLLAICFYLIRQGYSPRDITILSTYLEQDRFIKKTIDRKYNSTVREVSSTVVDNYQGEENTIILLSLVRSNDFGDVGFLSTKNRVCVALSRAKHGLFIFGNMLCLSKKEPTIWSDINDVLVNQESINIKFPLKCTKHNNITEVGSPEDVSALRNAGCSNSCETPLPCGHTCRQMCHGEDQGHEGEFSCREQCIRKCTNGHTCNAVCRADCPPCPVLIPKVLVCGHSLKLECHKAPIQSHCTETVEIKLDACGHNQLVLCRMTERRERIVCKAVCLSEFTCGHICKRTCHINEDPKHEITHLCEEPCELINKSCPRKHRCNKKCRDPCGDCLVKVEKTLPCNHKAMMKCSQDVGSFICKERCSRKLPCNHDCVNRCDEKCGPCTVKVEKVIEACGHKLNVRCSDEAMRSNCKERCQTIKSCGHQCSGLCKNICDEQMCHVSVNVELPCGHKSSLKCGDLEKRRHDIMSMCRTACQAVLPCGHLCEGTCGTCLQNRIHLPCTRPCEKTLVCSHKCRCKCNEAYHSCTTRNCLKKCWQNEMKNQSFYSKKGKGRNKRTEFDPENKLIWDLRYVLGRNSREMGKYARDLAGNKSISYLIDGIHEFVRRTYMNQYSDKRFEICSLKTCLFKVEFLSVFPRIFKRLTDSKMESSKKLELEGVMEKLIHRVSTWSSNMGGFEMQQLQEQMVWVSLAIDVQAIGEALEHDTLGVLQEALEQSKSSFGPNERKTVIQLMEDFKSVIGSNVHIQTEQWEIMFSESVQWCQSIHHHRPSYIEKDKKDKAQVVSEQEKDMVVDNDDKEADEMSGQHSAINTNEEKADNIVKLVSSNACNVLAQAQVEGEQEKDMVVDIEDKEVDGMSLQHSINPDGEKGDDIDMVSSNASNMPVAASPPQLPEPSAGDITPISGASPEEIPLTNETERPLLGKAEALEQNKPLGGFLGLITTHNSIVPSTSSSEQPSVHLPRPPESSNDVTQNTTAGTFTKQSENQLPEMAEPLKSDTKSLSEFLGLASTDTQPNKPSKVDWGKILQKELNDGNQNEQSGSGVLEDRVRRFMHWRGRQSPFEPMMVDSSDSDSDDGSTIVCRTSRQDFIQNLRIDDID